MSATVRLTMAQALVRYLAAQALVAVSTVVALWIAGRWGSAAVEMIYLPAVLAAAVWWGFGPALLAAITSALAYNFFFTEPLHTFRMDRAVDIVDVTVPDNALNVGEFGNFKVKVTNRGPLNLTDVKVHVWGENGVTVSKIPSAGIYVNDFIADMPANTISGHGGSLESVAVMAFQAPAQKQAKMELIKATLDDWNADLTHMLVAHSDPVPGTHGQTYDAQVFPK